MWIRSIAGALLAATLLSQGAAAQSDYRSCLSGLRSQAAAKGISGQAFDAATRGVEPDLKILELPYPLEARPEHELREIADSFYPQVLALLGVTP